MDRQIVYPGAIPLDTDILTTERNIMKAVGFLAQATLGTATVFDGLACTQQTVPNMTVLVGPGSALLLSTVDASSFGSLNSDASPLVKMGINTGSITLNTPAPGTTGQSINYLVQAAFQEADATSVVLPYYNSSNPAVPYSGPANAGTPQNTQRLQTVNVTVKAGTPATTGTQTTPAPDSGFTGLYVVTVAFGASSVINANISQATTNPFLRFKLPSMSSPNNAHGQCRLSVTSSTQLKLAPYNGCGLVINGTPQTIPSAGVTVANTGLAATTLYYVYAFMNGATMALECVTTSHTTNTDGVEIKTGDASRTLVGMVYTGAGTPGIFVVQTSLVVQCLSWFNRKSIQLVGANATGSVTTTTLAALGTASTFSFLNWGDEACSISLTGSSSNASPASIICTVSVGVDGSPSGAQSSATVPTTAASTPMVGSMAGVPAEGLHSAAPFAVVSSGSATFSLALMGIIRG